MQKGEVRNPVQVLLLGFVTCGIYQIIWLFSVAGEVNAALGEERFNMMKEIGLGIITCGAWMMWFLWRFCQAVVEVQQKAGVEPAMDAPILFVTNLFYLGPFFIQTGLNNAWENGGGGAAM